MSGFRTVLWIAVACVRALGAEPAPIPWNVEALKEPPAFEWLDRSGKVHALLYDAQPYQGRKTRVFAYYATPFTLGIEKDSGKRYPAVVLAHGGMGGAYSAWAEAVAKRGYAAIAPCLNGKDKHIPDSQRGPRDADDQTIFFPKAKLTGPSDYWQYHAVADLILAHSLVRSFPEVDADRTGIWGISWGGYCASIVIGLDDRFKAAVSMYGCGFLHENGQWAYKFKNTNITVAEREEWIRLWDPSSYVGKAATPVLFLNSDRDNFYPLDTYAKTYALVKAPKNISVQPGLRHAHIYDQKEAMLFLDERLRGGTPLTRVTKVHVEDGKVTADVEGAVKIKSATLQYTTGAHSENGKRSWESHPLTNEGARLTGDAAPAGVTAWFVSVVDERGAVVSSELMIR